MGLGVCTKCQCQRYNRALTFNEKMYLAAHSELMAKVTHVRESFAAVRPLPHYKCVCRHRMSEHDALYGAIASAMHAEQLSFGWSFRAETQAKAEALARGNTFAPDVAVVRVWSCDGFVAIASAVDNSSLGWGTGPTREDAEREALHYCEGPNAAVAVSVDILTGEARGKVIR